MHNASLFLMIRLRKFYKSIFICFLFEILYVSFLSHQIECLNYCILCFFIVRSFQYSLYLVKHKRSFLYIQTTNGNSNIKCWISCLFSKHMMQGNIRLFFREVYLFFDKLKQSLYRRGQALSVPRYWCSQIARGSKHENVNLSAVCTGRIYSPQNTPSTHFC